MCLNDQDLRTEQLISPTRSTPEESKIRTHVVASSKDLCSPHLPSSYARKQPPFFLLLQVNSSTTQFLTHICFFPAGSSWETDWVIGGLYLVVDCVAASLYLIVQASILKKYPIELIVVFFYCFHSSILSAIVSLFMDRNLNAWMLQPGTRLCAVLYSHFKSVMFWCIRRKGPLFVAIFHPLGIVIAAALGIIFLGDIFYLGSLVGSIIIVVGFYAVMWRKTKEEKVDEDKLPRNINSKALLLQIKDAETKI